MKRTTILFIPILVLLFVSSSATKREPRPLKKLDIRFLKGDFVVGPTTKTSPKCQITFLKPVLPKTILQAAATVELDGKLASTPSGTANEFTQVNSSGLFRLGGFEVKIVDRGPVVFGSYLYIVLYDGTDFTTEISHLKLFNWFYKYFVIKFIKSFHVPTVNNPSKNRKCLRKLPKTFEFPLSA